MDKSIFSYLFNSRGYVLIIVLLITTLLIGITTEFIVASQTNIEYMRKFSKRLKAGYLARSGVELAKFILAADKQGIASTFFPGKSSNSKIDSYNDVWAINFPSLNLGDGFLKIQISDENSKINLSVLANEFVEKTPYYGIVQRFFLNLGLSMDYADIIIDWVDIDDTSFPFGAESSDFYLSLEKPYSAKNGEMDSIDEMLLLKNMTPEIYYGLGGGNFGLEENLTDNNKGDVDLDIKGLVDVEGIEDVIKMDKSGKESERKIGMERSRRLSDYFRVYGRRDVFNDELNKININTAPYRVISALTDNMTADVVTEIINRRLTNPYKSIDDIKDLIDADNFNNLKNNILTVKSFIFKITSTAVIRNTRVKVIAYYNRNTRRFLYWFEQ